jgi:hypothetical protein
VKTTRGYTATYDGNDYPYTGNPNADTLALTGNAYVSPTLKKRRNLERLSTDGQATPLTGPPAASSG